MQTFPLIVGFVLYVFVYGLLSDVLGSSCSEKLSKGRMESLLKAWEDYELGSSRSDKRPAKRPGRVTAPWIIWSTALVTTLGIVAGDLALNLGFRALFRVLDPSGPWRHGRGIVAMCPGEPLTVAA